MVFVNIISQTLALAKFEAFKTDDDKCSIFLTLYTFFLIHFPVESNGVFMHMWVKLQTRDIHRVIRRSMILYVSKFHMRFCFLFFKFTILDHRLSEGGVCFVSSTLHWHFALISFPLQSWTFQSTKNGPLKLQDTVKNHFLLDLELDGGELEYKTSCKGATEV